MKLRRIADEMADAVVAYCEAIPVPDVDEASILATNRVRVRYSAPSRTRLVAVPVAVFVGLVLLVCNVPAVVAGVQRVFAAFSVASGRTLPMTIRAVNLERARADMPFAVIAPPSIAGARLVAVNEIYAESAASDASVAFEFHGTAPGTQVMIIESDAARYRGPTVFAIAGTADPALVPGVHWTESAAPAYHSKPGVEIRGSFQGRTFAPASWVAHGTRIAVMSPPGFLSSAQLHTIRHVMSR